jgi:hypothetical protein
MRSGVFGDLVTQISNTANAFILNTINITMSERVYSLIHYLKRGINVRDEAEIEVAAEVDGEEGQEDPISLSEKKISLTSQNIKTNKFAFDSPADEKVDATPPTARAFRFVY